MQVAMDVENKNEEIRNSVPSQILSFVVSHGRPCSFSKHFENCLYSLASDVKKKPIPLQVWTGP
jgi:hypothetical protein